jgi:hypothetical protein
MAVHAKIINWHMDSWHAFHKCLDGHLWVLRITRSYGTYQWQVRRGGPRFVSNAELMDTGDSQTLVGAKLEAIRRMHQLVVDRVPEMAAGRQAVHDTIAAALVGSPDGH